ncbi:MAG TPA: hypothetical protein VFE50_17840 [Cyclobacteriaceae bacterium]|nr:hypothetical protein [Cyclobacteriaceae bacterium]
MRLSNRGILLVIGIVVAIVVTLTTLVYKDRAAAEKRDGRIPRKTSLMKTTAHRLAELFSHSVTHR